MTKLISFESRTLRDPQNPELHAVLEAELYIECRDRDGCDATYEVEGGLLSIQGTDVVLNEADLSPEDQVYLDRLAQDCADENACEAAQDWAERAADAAYDRWKDGDQ